MTDSVSRRDWLRITAVSGIAVGLGGGLSLSALEALGMRRVSQTRTRMGTVVTLTVLHRDGDFAVGLIERAFAEMERLEGVLSRYRPDSAVGRLNRLGAIGDAPPELLDVLDTSRRVHAMTGGAFDVTVGPLVDVYAAAAPALPPDRVVAAALDRVGLDKLSVDGTDVRFAVDGMALTLDGVAKGYIVDRTRDLFVGEGVTKVLVNAGGDIRAHDDSGTDPWTVGVQDPDDANGALRMVRLTTESIATSSLPMRAFVHDRTHPQILDPRSGRPADRVRSVTVRARSAMAADALSTGLMVLGPDASKAPDDSLEHEALFVLASGGVRQTAGFDADDA